MIVFWFEDDADSLSYHVRGIIMIIFALNLIANPVAYFILNRRARTETFTNCCQKKSNLLESNSPAENQSTTNEQHQVDQQATTHLTLPVSSSSSSATPQEHAQSLPILKEPAQTSICAPNHRDTNVNKIDISTHDSPQSAHESSASRDQPPSLTYKLELPSVSGCGNYLQPLDIELSSVRSSRTCSTSSSPQDSEGLV